MNLFKRALIQVKANIGKSILIFLIFFMTMGAVSTGFMTSRMYNRTLKETFKDGVVPVYVSLQYGGDTLLSSFSNAGSSIDFIQSQQYFDMADFEEVDSSTISMNEQVKAGQLKVKSYEDNGLDVQFDTKPEIEEDGYAKGVYTFDYDKDAFKSDPNSVILNDEIMELNNLEVGDKITLDLNSEYSNEAPLDELKAVELTIVGSYTITPTQKMIDDANADAKKYDYEPDPYLDQNKGTIYMPQAAGIKLDKLYTENLGQTNNDVLLSNGTYSLRSLKDLKPFTTKAEELIGAPIDVRFDLGEDESGKADSLYKIEEIKSILKYFMAFGIVLVVVMLTIIITLFIRGRKKEIGIMVALGETRKNIYFQLVLEQVLIMITATILAYPICFGILMILSKKFGFQGMGITIVPLLLSIAVGAVIIGLITIIPAVYTLRVKPKKILL